MSLYGEPPKGLKSCPLCGYEAELITRGNDHTKNRKATVKCKNCRLKITVGAIRNSMAWAIEMVVEKWNKRAEVK